MERYKKRTIALCLASALTVVGAFGAENYNNTLMALKVNVGSGGYVNLTAFTKNPYNSPLKTSKIDDNTFVITLNDTDSNTSEPDIENFENIESIQITTFPYTTTSDGCTRIVVKTLGAPSLLASQALYLPNNMQQDGSTIVKPEPKNSSSYSPTKENSNNTDYKETEAVNSNEIATPPDFSNIADTNSSSAPMTVVLWISILLVLIGLIFIFSRDKMSSVVGEHGDFDFDNNEKNKKQSKTKKIKSTINKLDKMYPNRINKYEYSYAQADEYATTESENTEITAQEEQEQSVIVDLDTLYNESQKESAPEQKEEIDDLADLLNSFADDYEEEPEPEPFDEELFNEIINNNNIKFSDDDIKKINQLLQLEISKETLDELKKFLSTPIIKPLTQEQLLENILASYSVKQNIDFSKEDVDAIKKLMNVELGPDFVKDFTTNPARTKAVEKEIAENSGIKSHKASEIITLNVKSLLPNLSEELKKQGNKAIKSEAKPTVVYFSEGYEYDKLDVSGELPSLADSLNGNNEQNQHKPSYKDPIVATGYDVSTLSISDDLPDLADAVAHPQKYKEQNTQITKVDENALLKSISNVTFKPFYEESDNEIDDFDNLEQLTENINKEARNDDNAKKLLKLIEEQQNERAMKKQAAEDDAFFQKELEAFTAKNSAKKKPQVSETYNYNGNSCKLLKTIKCTPTSECKMLQYGSKYIVIGKIGNEEFLLKQYDSLKISEMHIRQNDKSDKTRYLVKIGTHKFVIRITSNKMEFVMDLC